MQSCIKKEAMGDDPPYLAVGTEVSAKYKGAFCEAKVRKVVRSVKCKVTFKLGLGTAIVTDDQIRGTLRSGSSVEARHPEKKDFVEASITKIQDCSQYTVVFDDGDITTLRRSALCLKSGRHFAESETLDQLPLTHPEHFSTPVIGGSRRGRRSRQTHDDGSDDEEDASTRKGKKKEEKEVDIGKVVCVELGERKKQKDNWFPGLVVAPTAQDTVRIRVKEEYLVRSFKDGRYYTVPKKEATEFTREIGAKVDNNTLKTAVEKALQFLDRDELPPHWDRELLFGMDGSSGDSDSDAGSDSDSSDDEPREEKDHFVAQLYKFMDDRGTPINKGPTIGMKDVDLYKLFKVVHKIGGYNRVTNHNQWKMVSQKLGFGQNNSSNTNHVKQAYKKFLHSFEDFYRKLGCTMVNHPRGSRSRHRSSRSLIRDRDRATPINTPKRKEGEEKPSTAIATKKVEKEETTKVEEDKKKEEVQKEEKKEDKKVEEKKAEKKPDKKVEEKKEEKKGDGKKEDKKEEAEKVGGRVVRERESSKALEETKTKESTAPKKETKSKAKEFEGKTRDSVGKAKAKEEAAKVKEKAEKAAAAAAASTAPEPKVKEEKEEKPIKVEETTTPKTRAKDDSSEKKNSVVEEPTIPSSVKVEPSDNVVKSPTSSVVASKAPETLKVEPVEVTSPVLSVEVRKGRELGLRSQVKDLPSMEVTPKDVKLAEKDKSRGLEDVRDMMHEDLKMRMEEEDEVDDDEDDEEEDDDGRKDSSSVTGEESKREERRREREKRGEDEEKLTRSKSKESNPERKTRESRTPVRESESKKGPSKMGSGMGVVGSANAKRPVSSSSSSASSGSGGASAEEERKRGRKRKDLDEKSSKSEEHLGQLSNHIHVGVGDKLKVYYGPTHESKVTYEAKVIDTEIDGHQTLYLVHYTGWNNRYDEWIKRSRIAENLSWTPTRAKRLRQQQQSQSMKPMGKRGRPSLSGGTSRTSVDGGNGGPPGSQQQMGAQTRSTTPSGSSQSPSVRGAGSSGASPSPSTPTSAGMRGVTTRGNSGMASADYSPVSSFSIEMRRRSRRMSGHTDLSMMSESESEEYESEPEIEPLRTRSRGERKTSISITPSKEEMTPTEEKPSKELKGGDSRLLRKRGKRKKEKVDEEEDDKKDAEELSDNLDGSITAFGMEGQEQPQQSEMAEDLGTSPGEKKRTKRTTRRSARDESERLLDNLNVDMTPLDMEDDMPKGRDFDLNQIRSELKGIEKAVKLPIDLPSMQSESGEAMDVSEDNPSQEEDVDSKESDIKEPPILVLEASVPVAEEVAEDIYEFKEPEPFEFEVRSKRDSLNLEDRGMKLGRRCQSRLMNRREMKTSPKNSESKEAMGSWGGESISSFRASSGRRNASKKSEDTTPTDEAVAKSLSPSRSDLKSGDSEASHSSSKVPSSSSSSCESSASKVHPTPGSDDDDAPLTLPSKHSSLPDEEEHPKKSVPSSGSVAKNRSSPFGRISSSTSMFSPRKSPSLNSPSAASPPSIHSIDLEPLCLFRDLPSSADGDVGEEDDGGDESEDRLIISDDPGEVEAPLFTYPQRHEELFPASLVSSAGVGSSCDDTEETRKRTDDEPPCLVPMSLFELQGKSGEKGDKEGHPGIERSEVVKVVVQKEEDGAEMEAVIVKKPQTTKCSDSFNDDVIKLLLKDEEEEEGEGEGDESINAAIQRAISSDIMDEDDDDDESLTLFGKKSAKEFFRQSGKDKETASPVDKKDEGRSKAPPPPPKNSTVEEVIEKKEVEAVETAKSKSPEPQVSTTKPSSTPSREESVSVVVREYDSPTDIDSDSSEESRLVIDKLDEGGDDYSVTSIESDTERETKEDSSAVDSVVIADSAKVEHEKKCTAKPDVIGGRDEPKVEEESAKDAESDKQTVPVVAPVEKEESEPVMKPSVEKANPKEEKEVNEWKLESAKEAECTKGQTENQAKFDEEADSSLRSLLCEETIPGSPVPPANDPRESCTELPEKQSKVPEMPFASVPGSENCTSTNLLRSDNVRNDNAMCGGGSSSSLTPGAPILKGSLEAFPSESSVATPQCCPPAPSGNETNASENESGKDAGGNDAAPVMDNTPPTTPESSLSTLSGSPREERGGSSPGLDNDSSKSHRESSEIDLDSPVEGNKDHFSEDSLLNIEVSNSEDNNQLILLQGLKVSSAQKRPGGQDSEKDSSVAIGAASAGAQDSPSKKKRRTHRRNEESVQGTKRLRHGAGRGRNMGGSDSDDTSENSTSGGCTPLASTESVVSSRSPRPSKYNFYVELDPELDGTQRIALLQQKLQELRKTYMSVKAELACIDRRRKKLRRREREEKAAKHEVACS